ncbi:MAG TPA: DUF4376 domain-containing protein [Coprothermobacter proteolyticus]|nr:DUF4376 domain-containing protein [Coprothermobacter proteolyticus]
MFIRNGKRFSISQTLEENGFRFTSADLSKPDIRAFLGVTEIADPVRKNEDFWYNQEIDDAPYLTTTPKSAEQIQSMLWGKIKQKRDSLQADGYKIAGKWYHSDEKSKIQQITLAMMGASLPAGIQWKTMDGSFVEMTPTLAQQIFAGAAAHEQSIFAKAEFHKNAVNGLQSIESLESYDWNAGWPESFSTRQE